MYTRVEWCVLLAKVYYLSIMSLIFFNYIIKRFSFGEKTSLNHVANFPRLHPLQRVLFWWQDLSQSCGGFSSIKSSSKGSILIHMKKQKIWASQNIRWIGLFFVYLLLLFVKPIFNLANKTNSLIFFVYFIL